MDFETITSEICSGVDGHKVLVHERAFFIVLPVPAKGEMGGDGKSAGGGSAASALAIRFVTTIHLSLLVAIVQIELTVVVFAYYIRLAFGEYCSR